jgi:RHS repeat-associated protein
MFDPTTGTWIQEDPIGFEAGDPNLRRYAGNDPTNRTDRADSPALR